MCSAYVQHELPSLRFEVFDVLRFVEYHVLPSFVLKDAYVLCHQLVRRDAHMERVWPGPALYTHK